MQSHFHTDQDLIKALCGTDSISNKAIHWLLINDNYKKITYQYVLNQGGSQEDVDDVFAEAIEVLVENIILLKFQGKSKVTTYFYSICKNIYLAKYRPKGIEVASPSENDHPGGNIEDDIIEKEENKKRLDMFEVLFERLNEKCKKVLDLKRRGLSMEDIANAMGWVTQSAKNKANFCEKKMRQILETLKAS